MRCQRCDTSRLSKNEEFESYSLYVCMVYTPFTLLQGKRLQLAIAFHDTEYELYSYHIYDYEYIMV